MTIPLTTARARMLGQRDLPRILDVLRRDPAVGVFVESRILAGSSQTWRVGGELWGADSGGGVEALCYCGANLVPVASDRSALDAFADELSQRPRRCSSILGPAEQVLGLWDLLESPYGTCREVRADQPLLAIADQPRVSPDPLVRRVRADEIDLLVPACVAMFTEEVGVSPLGYDGGAQYRARIAELIAAGRAFARIEDGQVVFKAEVGSVSATACQVQGVWVRPDRRGEGLAAGGMAAVVAAARATMAPLVTLYVNAHNEPARRTYAKVGFAQVGTFATVLF